MSKRASHWPRKRQYWARQWARIHAPISHMGARRRRVKLRRERQFQKWITFIAEACVQASRSIQESYMEIGSGLDRAFVLTDHPIITVQSIQSSDHHDGPWFTHMTKEPWATIDPSDASQIMPGIDSEHVDAEAWEAEVQRWEAEVQRVVDEARARREGQG